MRRRVHGFDKIPSLRLFRRTHWIMFVAGAVPMGAVGWWLGSRAELLPRGAVWAVALSSLTLLIVAARGAWRWIEDVRRTLNEANANLMRERARLEKLVERIPDALIITNLRGEVTFLNDAALVLLGATRIDVQPRGSGLLVPVDPTRWRLRVQEMLKAHSSGGLYELVRPDGSPASSYRTTVTMFTDPVTGDFGVLMLLRDRTMEHHINLLKEEFFEAAAHDLRTPLFAIQGYMRMLEKSITPDEKQRKWIDVIDSSCARLVALIKDALDSSRIDGGHYKIQLTSVEPRVLLRQISALFEPLALERGITLEMRLAEDVPAEFVADERLVERLLHNLVANALKFTPRDGKVSVEISSAGADRVELVVTDTGPGIPDAQRAVVFEKFRQLDSAAPLSGFGLGLSICAKIVKLHKGEIWVQAAKDGGAQFIVRLPLVQIAKEVVTK